MPDPPHGSAAWVRTGDVRAGRDIVFGLDLAPNALRNTARNYFDFYRGTAEHPVPFAGRHAEMAKLDAWLADAAAPPRMLVSGAMASGKSALLVRWASQVTSHQVLFLPISIRFNTNAPGIFFEALAANLAAMAGTRLAAPAGDPDRFYRDAAIGLLRDFRPAPGDGRSCLLIIDGLDEAAGWDLGPETLPATLGSLRVLVAARPGPDDDGPADWLRRLGWGRPGREATTLPVGPLQRADLRDLVDRTLTGLPPALRPGIADALLDLTHGDALLLRFLAEDIEAMLAQGEVPDAALLRKREAGLAAFVRDELKKHVAAADPAKAARLKQEAEATLAILAHALGSLPEADLWAVLSRLLPGPAPARPELLAALSRFIARSSDGGLALAHPRLGQLVTEEILARSPVPAAAGKALLDWQRDAAQTLLDSSATDTSTYLLTYHAQHLAAAGSAAGIQDWARLVAEPWVRARRQAGARGVAADAMAVQRALTAAGERRDPQALAALLRATLLLSSLRSLGAGTPAELVAEARRRGLITADEALAIAASKRDGDAAETYARLARDEPDPALQEFLLESALSALPLEQEVGSWVHLANAWPGDQAIRFLRGWWKNRDWWRDESPHIGRTLSGLARRSEAASPGQIMSALHDGATAAERAWIHVGLYCNASRTDEQAAHARSAILEAKVAGSDDLLIAIAIAVQDHDLAVSLARRLLAAAGLDGISGHLLALLPAEEAQEHALKVIRAALATPADEMLWRKACSLATLAADTREVAELAARAAAEAPATPAERFDALRQLLSLLPQSELDAMHREAQHLPIEERVALTHDFLLYWPLDDAAGREAIRQEIKSLVPQIAEPSERLRQLRRLHLYGPHAQVPVQELDQAALELIGRLREGRADADRYLLRAMEFLSPETATALVGALFERTRQIGDLPELWRLRLALTEAVSGPAAVQEQAETAIDEALATPRVELATSMLTEAARHLAAGRRIARRAEVLAFEGKLSPADPRRRANLLFWFAERGEIRPVLEAADLHPLPQRAAERMHYLSLACRRGSLLQRMTTLRKAKTLLDKLDREGGQHGGSGTLISWLYAIAGAPWPLHWWYLRRAIQQAERTAMSPDEKALVLAAASRVARWPLRARVRAKAWDVARSRGAEEAGRLVQEYPQIVPAPELRNTAEWLCGQHTHAPLCAVLKLSARCEPDHARSLRHRVAARIPDLDRSLRPQMQLDLLMTGGPESATRLVHLLAMLAEEPRANTFGILSSAVPALRALIGPDAASAVEEAARLYP